MASRPEHEILLLVNRRELDPDSAAKLRQLLGMHVDWEYLQSNARRHGLLPLLQKHANRAAGELIPSQYRSSLKQESVTNAQNVLHLMSKALKVQKVFTEHDIQTAVFKGPILSQIAYGEIGLRQAGDIDVLIHRKDFVRARGLLESLGYQMYPQLTAAQQASHLAFHCEIQFMRDAWFTVVDLHWGLTPKSFVFGLSGDAVMSRLETISFAGSQIQTFSPADLVLYQAMHSAKHLWRRLEWLGSLYELTRRLEPAAWSVVIERAVNARARKILGLGLRLVENLYDQVVPTSVLSELDSNGQMKHFANRICDEFFVTTRPYADSTETNLYNLKIMDRKRDALASTLRAIFVPTFSDWEALSLPSTLHPLYYAFRPIRLSGVYGASLVRKLAHKSES